MKIVLIGFMGSGKTTVARVLAKKRNLNFIDMDYLALKNTTRFSINEIFEKDGEEKFRELELDVAKLMSQKENCVISTGGGVVMNPKIMEYLKTNSVVIYLRKNFDRIKEHIALKKVRPPLFQTEESAKKLFEFRAPQYVQYADMIIETDNKNIDKLIEEIDNKLGANYGR